jgi:hypothetical protein
MAAPVRLGGATRRQRLAFLGPPAWLETSCPPRLTRAYASRRVPVRAGGDINAILDAVEGFAPDVTVVFDPVCLPAAALDRLPGLSLGILVRGADCNGVTQAAGALDRVLSFRPALTGTSVGSQRVWRAIPPPIADELFSEVRPLSGAPQAMAIGRSTEYREHLLMPAKHHHDVLQVVSGVSGESLVELLGEYDVGIYVPPAYGGGFGAQAGIHLAAGQLLLAHALEPTHGLEQGIDYLPFDAREELVWILDRLRRFPEMCQRIRIRGRMKAESYRASRIFARIVHDLRLDAAAFGSRAARS